MRKLSEIRGEDALDALADMLEPAAEILGDAHVAAAYKKGNGIKACAIAIRNHKKAVMKVLAILDGEDVETYSPPLMAIPIKLLEAFNDPDVQMVFQSQGQKEDGKSFGSAMESIEETEAK